ncbi:MAG: hypothetical protein BWK79_19775 [Beggiatoa sp. IS2]|nr:MAG: hypothetical protein BWK79_19775 [Beggiatoa sp. IS2]
MINNLRFSNIRLFVFGTLRTGGELDYYMEGSSLLGLYYTRGQLMESANGSAYVDFSVEHAKTVGELHHINFYCLQRINYLEITWSEFPKGYELTLVPVWVCDGSTTPTFNEEQKSIALCYKRRENTKVCSGDWAKRRDIMSEIGRLLKDETEKAIYYNDVIIHLVNYLAD